MKQFITGGLEAAPIAGGLLSAAPPASAGCLYGGWMAASRCDGPVQPDGTWQRCVVFNANYSGLPGTATNYGGLDHRCDVMGLTCILGAPPSMTLRRISTTEPKTLRGRMEP